MLVGQLPHASPGHVQFHSLLRSILLPMKNDPVVALLTLQESQQQEMSLEELFERAEVEDNAEVCSGTNILTLCLRMVVINHMYI